MLNLLKMFTALFETLRKSNYLKKKSYLYNPYCCYNYGLCFYRNPFQLN